MLSKQKYPNGLKAEMTRRNIKQAALARLMEIDRQQVARYYHGEYRLDRDWSERFAEALGTTPETLMFADGAPAALNVPMVSWVSASSFADPGFVDVEPERWLPIAGLGRGDFFALEVRGDSMDLISPEGSTIIVDRNLRDLRHNKPFVVLNGNETTYKLWDEELRVLQPWSSNRVHRAIPIHDDRFSVIGQVRRTMLDL